MATDKSVGRVRPQATARGTGAGGDGRRQRVAKYLAEVRTELKKTTWPSKQELVAQTQVVLGLLLVIGVFIYVWDTFLGQVFRGILWLVGVRH